MSGAVRGTGPRERSLPVCAVRVHGRLEAANGPGLVVRGQRRHDVDPTLWAVAVHGQITPTLTQAVAAALLPGRRLVRRERVLRGRTAGAFERDGHHEWQLAQQAAAHVAASLLGLGPTLDGAGALVLGVAPGSPADGLLRRGDLVVAAAGLPVRTAGDLTAALAAGARALTVLPAVRAAADGGQVERRLPGAPGTPVGLRVATHRPRSDRALDVDVELCPDAAGASSGLVLALALLDVLSPGSLTGGLDVAVTGALALDGRVQQVAGAREKATAAARAGMDLLLVPAGDLDEALRGARGTGLPVVGVTDVVSAVAALVAAGGTPPTRLPAPAPVDRRRVLRLDPPRVERRATTTTTSATADGTAVPPGAATPRATTVAA